MHVMFRDLCFRDVPKDGSKIAVVRERDLESFYVRKQGSRYIVENRTVLVTPRTASTLTEVRQIIARPF